MARHLADFREQLHTNTADTSKVLDRIRQRFGIVPNFFRLTLDAPEITERLWTFAESAYLDNPLPRCSKKDCSYGFHAFARPDIALRDTSAS